MYRHLIFLLAVQSLMFLTLQSRTLPVGQGLQYADPGQAARNAVPGDTILIAAGSYRGTFWIEGLNGTESLPIVLRGVDRSLTVFDGGTESMHFSECSWLVLENFTVRGQTGNGMNIDDGGTIETPTHHITIRDVSFLTMAASGNNDQLKLSGLDYFIIEDCEFNGGAGGGSGIDMVGCHQGVIRNNAFSSMGSNAIQCKGGTQWIEISRNRFTNAGERAINLGGSTGLAFFRPIDATFEAADLRVWANVFVGSTAPIAYVGCVRVDVSNNTIIHPTTWVFRVLQETVDPSRFSPCGDNIFRNNIIVYKSSIRSHVNIGSNTAPETFLLQNNLWYNETTPSSSRPNLGALTETASIYGSSPSLRNAAAGDAYIDHTSIAVGKGVVVPELETDIAGRQYATPPSIGAYEGAVTTSVAENNIVQEDVRVVFQGAKRFLETTRAVTVRWYDVQGRFSMQHTYDVGSHPITPSCWYFVEVRL